MFNLLKKYKHTQEDVYEIPELDAELELSVRGELSASSKIEGGGF
jgi:hypothetical protein